MEAIHIILTKVSLKFAAKSLIGSSVSLVKVMAWRRRDSNPFSVPMMTQFTDAYVRQNASLTEALCRTSM